MRSLPSGPVAGLRLGLHALVLAIVAVVLGRAAAVGGAHPRAAIVACLAFTAWYAVGAATLDRAGRAGLRSRVVWGWVAGLLVVWGVLLWATDDAVWLAFPLFFLVLHLLPHPGRLGVVALVTAAAVAAYGWHGAFTPAAAIGPVLGGAVAVATVLGYEALHQESELRRTLLEQLVATQRTLAESERAAGAMAERDRLAREIHDTIAQGLTSVHLQLRAGERALPQDPEAALSHLRIARETTVASLEEARRFVRALPPAGLEDQRLAAAVRSLAERVERESGVPVGVEVVDTGDARSVPADVEAALLRITQSALANAVQHARATRIDVTVDHSLAFAGVTVRDDGLGFDPGSAVDGHGLSVMRARVRAVGGELRVSSGPGRGTSVEAVVPATWEAGDA